MSKRQYITSPTRFQWSVWLLLCGLAVHLFTRVLWEVLHPETGIPSGGKLPYQTYVVAAILSALILVFLRLGHLAIKGLLKS
jgi:hypothetical protein